MAGQSEVIRVLAKYGADLNDNTARGYTPLHCAAAWGRLETLKVLVVELDVDIEALNFRQELARDVAARYSQTECVEFLDWAAARLALKRYILKVSATLAESEKGPGRLFKEDKNNILTACRIRSEWLETQLEASINEIFEQKQQLEDIVTPIFTKMATPHLSQAMPSFVSSICFLFCLCVSCARASFSWTTFPFSGISKMYTDIIRGESMIICGVTSIFFGILRNNLVHMFVFREFHVLLDFIFHIFGSILVGYWSARIIQFILTDLFSNTLTSIILCVSMVYMTFYIVEFLKLSGMVALITVGLNLDSLSFKPRMEIIITKLLTIVLVSPILMRSSYEYNWRWGVVIAWSGIKGVFNLLLAPDIYNLSDKNVESPEMSNAVQFHHISPGAKEQESPTDEVLIEEARLHVAIIQMLLIPTLINIVDVQIKRRLSLMYSITKGYVKSQEDAKFLIKQISSRESIYQKLYEILETNKRDAIRELGLIEHEDRDVVIALKTRQAIQTVIAKSLKHLSFLCSRGIIDKHEGIEMNKVLLSKIKALNNFPMSIPPPTPDKYLHNIVWLENKDVLIEFFKERAKLAYFDYGDVICKEGEMPQGIYLIISGMAILHSSPPTFGVDSVHRLTRQSQTLFTEYCTCGDIIGELSCLLKREIEYTAICETILQACFISLEDLYEGFDVFWPSLEYKIWLKLALSTAYQYFESALVDERCVALNVAYVDTLSNCNEMTIDWATMKLVIVVYGSVMDTKTEAPFLAPCILSKTCEQVQGTSDLSKLLIIQATEPVKVSSDSKITECDNEKGFILTSPFKEETMKIQNNSIPIPCDGFYLISLKGYFSQELSLSLHYRKNRKPLFSHDKVTFVDSITVASLGFKDKVYLNVTTHNTSCADIQVNGGELILIHQNPDRFCAE
ncbi:Sodium/hydrogen exchanger 11 [Myotis davidii]|uniref:Tumor necrosis factor ligand superfamily member 4 n=1 Tax=Myotis davidii TaxID=225400 RepID=L5LP45_MYODS|nr:Sodium/hydrogen exchanger 11 [Myotis davidii]